MGRQGTKLKGVSTAVDRSIVTRAKDLDLVMRGMIRYKVTRDQKLTSSHPRDMDMKINKRTRLDQMFDEQRKRYQRVSRLIVISSSHLCSAAQVILAVPRRSRTTRYGQYEEFRCF